MLPPGEFGLPPVFPKPSESTDAAQFAEQDVARRGEMLHQDSLIWVCQERIPHRPGPPELFRWITDSHPGDIR
jgi:hypothetical protein